MQQTPRGGEPEAGHLVAGRYRLERVLGRGGMGVVWQARDELLHRPVALKSARPDDERAARRLMSEATNAARLHHPNIVGVFDLVEEGGVCWIVLEYVPSPSLARVVEERGLLTPEQAGSVGRQIAAALEKSHAEGVVHGDVTPENILLGEDGTARLTDFGISRAKWSDLTRSTTGAVRGKPRYLAPEVAKGEPAGEKADVFSLGATVYAAVEGRSPYGEADTMWAYLARAVAGRIVPPERTGPLTEPLMALLEVEPRPRPDAARARALLASAAAPPSGDGERGDARDVPQEPTVHATVPLGPAAGPPPSERRGRRPFVATAAVLAAAAAVTAVIVVLSDTGSGEQRKDEPEQRAAAAGAVGDPRTADPCGLLDPASLSRFGATGRDPEYGEFSRCDVLVKSPGGGEEIADIRLLFEGEPADFGGDVPTRRVGNVTVATMQRDGDDCERVIATPDGRQIVVTGRRFAAPSPDPCQMADAATDHAVGVLDRGPVPRRPVEPDAASLARLDACDLLDAGALKAVPGVRAETVDPGFAGWECDWESADGDSGVEIVFTRDNNPADDGEAVETAGTLSYVSPAEEGDGTCVVRTPHRTYTNAAGDRTVELFTLTVRAPQSAQRLCGTGASLAAATSQNIAKRLPEGERA